jgi:hypothetical protein
MARFTEFLRLLGYEHNLAIHHRHSLVRSILEWAVLQGDIELAVGCDK